MQSLPCASWLPPRQYMAARETVLTAFACFDQSSVKFLQTISISSVNSTVFAARAPVDREQYGAGLARPARAYTRGLYCFQPQGSPATWISGRAEVSHCVPGQGQRRWPCQRPFQRVAFSLVGGPTPLRLERREGRCHGVCCWTLVCPGGSPYC